MRLLRRGHPSRHWAECGRRLRDKAKELRDSAPTGVSARTTVKAYATDWLTKQALLVRPKTYTTDRAGINNWIVPTIGHIRLSELVTEHVRMVAAAQRKAGRSSATMNRYQGVLVKMLRDAIADGHRINPGILGLDKPKPGESDREGMTVPQALKALAVIETKPDPSRWVASILNGMRLNERLGLTWPLVDFEKKIIDVSWQLQALPYLDAKDKSKGFIVPDGYVYQQLDGSLCLVRPKTNRGRRVIPMTPWMEASLLQWRDRAPASPHGLVWCREDGRPIRERVDRAEWAAIQKDAGIAHPTGRPFVIHENRHATITLLQELDVPDDVIEQIVGHSKLVKAYQHSDLLPRSRAALERLATHLALGVGD